MSKLATDSKFITRKTRIALYLETDFTCPYCNQVITEIERLSIDHIVARVKNGNNHNTKNLITSCRDCNSRKRDLSVSQFARVIGENPQEIKSRIRKAKNRSLDLRKRKAERAMSHHGGYMPALQALHKEIVQ